MVIRAQNTKSIDLNIVGSSVFGRYPKISTERTYNMFISDNFLVDYAGYQVAIPSTQFMNAKEGRGIFTSTKFNKLVAVFDNNVYLINIQFNQEIDKVTYDQIFLIGQLQTYNGIVYITENNKPQICISDNNALYIYDPTLTPSFQTVTDLNFTPGYITFHDTYFICAASQDNTYLPPANNTWRLSDSNNGMSWPNTAGNVGLLQTKPDNVQAVVRFPSKGNMIFVMGSIVTEAWFDTGAQLFPYQRNNQFNIDYGCLSPASVAYMDEIVVWLAANERSGPIIMYSNGGMPQKITTDGIDFIFTTLQNPQDSQGFLYRQDGHLFYHINFYSDNISLFYDFNTDKFYNACDHRGNYFIASEIAFIGNQYYFVSKNNGNLFAFDTKFTTYQDVVNNLSTTIQTYPIPRRRICKNLRQASQEYFILNDVGFTIESGETDYFQYKKPRTIGFFKLLGGGDFLLFNDNQQFSLLGFEAGLVAVTPTVSLSISYDGGATYSNSWAYDLPGIGMRKNKLIWWQCGMTNDAVCQFVFKGIGRFVATNGIANIRT